MYHNIHDEEFIIAYYFIRREVISAARQHINGVQYEFRPTICGRYYWTVSIGYHFVSDLTVLADLVIRKIANDSVYSVVKNRFNSILGVASDLTGVQGLIRTGFHQPKLI